MDKILTIAIPSYNVETTLKKTVTSMLIPDAELRQKLDILIVNDGSKDGTLALAQQLEADNPGVVRVWNKENGGHGSTINVAIEQANGKYLKIVDGDDWLETDALEKYLHILRDTDADVVATDYYKYYMNSGVKQTVKASELPYDTYMDFDDIWSKYTFYMHSVGVKTLLLREQYERIDENCYYVDTEYDALIALYAKTILYVNIKLYVYRLEREGQSVSLQGWIKHYTDHEKIVLTQIKWLKYSKQYMHAPRYKLLEQSIIKYSKQHYYVGLSFPKNERKVFLKDLCVWDSKIKDESQEIYACLNRFWVIRLLRAANFSNILYSLFLIMRMLKEKFKKIFDKCS